MGVHVGGDSRLLRCKAVALCRLYRARRIPEAVWAVDAGRRRPLALRQRRRRAPCRPPRRPFQRRGLLGACGQPAFRRCEPCGCRLGRQRVVAHGARRPGRHPGRQGGGVRGRAQHGRVCARWRGHGPRWRRRLHRHLRRPAEACQAAEGRRRGRPRRRAAHPLLRVARAVAAVHSGAARWPSTWPRGGSTAPTAFR